ncbi:T9SS type B sorting domain-containing protein [Flavobacterium psychrotrophum]|uniref:T9SS type B sorting domain-containing protein n=1 Tax=Flavobacterium psychrotrophum TaxID=2294119 RepID=UPI000E3119AF|nr:T9SS type B sorting domain-containing protein [Flavobacterium psychrotrophum]
MKKLLTTIILLCGLFLNAQEICDNGIDDDGDGLVDVNDPDCPCQSGTSISSLIPNGSFENYSQCPDSYSQLNYCNGWVQATAPTTDYFNTCGFLVNSINDAALLPFPDGQGCTGAIFQTGYREYLGSCLPQPLVSGTDYHLSFYVASTSNDNYGDICGNNVIKHGPVELTLYGRNTCPQFPLDVWQNPNMHDAAWKVLGKVYYDPKSKWQNVTISFKPEENVNAIILGAPEFLDESYQDVCVPYFFFDKLVLNEAFLFGAHITQTGNYCDNTMQLHAVLDAQVIGNVQYQWYKDGIALLNETNAFLNIAAVTGNYASYKVKVNIDTNCYISTPYMVSQTILPPVAQRINPDCINDGTITITSPAAYYSFDDGLTWVTNPVKTGLRPGFHLLRIKTTAGCISDATGIYLSRPVLSAQPNYIYNQISCTSPGSIVITTPGSQYSFDDGVTWQSSNTLTAPVPFGVYMLCVKDSSGCRNEAIQVYAWTNANPAAEPQFSVAQPISCTTPNGIITITTPADEYSFDSGTTWSTSNTSAPLPQGIYNLSVRGTDRCMSSISVATINPPPNAPAAPTAVVTDPTCSLATGGITITSTAASYSFDNGITWTPVNSKFNLPPGDYSIKVKSAQDCISAATLVTISSLTGTPPPPSFSVVQPNCFSPTGIITITTTAPQYSFDNGLTWVTTNTSPPLAVGSYNILIKNAAGCPSSSVAVSITPDIVAPPVVQDITYCKDVTASALTANGSNLLWYDQPTGGVGMLTAPTPQTTIPGIYKFYVTSTTNCESARAVINVTVIDVLLPPVVDDISYCQDSATLPLTAIGTNLLWYTNATGGMPNTTAPTPSSAISGTYIYFVSQSAYGCESNRTPLVVTIIATPDIPVTEQYISHKHNTTVLPLTAEGTSLKWYDKDLNLLPNAPTPSTKKIGITYYYVNQTVDGCESELVKITVEIVHNYIKITYPRYFTPNGDSHNEKWNINHPENGVKATVFIFDRYGKIITQLFAPGNGWDGTLNGNPLPATDYWFKVIYSEYGEEKTMSSHFSLIR